MKTMSRGIQRLAPLLMTFFIIFGILGLALGFQQVFLPGTAGASGAAAVAEGWTCDSGPQLRYKGVLSENGKNLVGTNSGQTTQRIVAVALNNRGFRIWFEQLDGQPGVFRDFSWDNVPGFEYQEGDAYSFNPVDFAVTTHDGRLKIVTSHFQGSYPGTDTNIPRRILYIYDTGCRVLS